MKLRLLYTKRKYENRFFYDLVYEWEDILVKELKLKLRDYDEEWAKYERGGIYEILRFKTLRRLIKHFKLVRHIFIPSIDGLKLDMWTQLAPRFNDQHIIPWIIDFFLEEKDFESFNECYRGYPVVFISSREVYEILKSHGDIVKDVNLRHVALSLPDQYRIQADTKYNKEYDVVLMGRQNPQLLSFFMQYVKLHPGIKYAYRRMEEGHFNYYAVDNGNETFIGDFRDRKQYFSLMQKSRIGLHATPDMDNHERAHGYNQVTPRFLEWLSCGAHVIARYVPNPDTEYYRLQDFSEPIETYDQFEKAMDYAMTHEVDMEKYANYLTQHYTSVRAQEIKRIISEL